MNKNSLNSEALAAGLQVFMDESKDLISQMENLLLKLESGSGSDDDISALFRCAHTIKGSSGMFGMTEVERFTHVVESVLDRVRNHALELSSELVSVLLDCQDHIARLIDQACNGLEADTAFSDRLIDRLSRWLPSHSADAKTPMAAPETPQPIQSASGLWHLSLRFSPDVMSWGMDPLRFIQFLEQLGRIHHLITLTDALPHLQENEASSCFLGFELSLETSASRSDIEEVFEFFGNDMQLGILEPGCPPLAFRHLIESRPEEEAAMLGWLVECGTLNEGGLAALDAPAEQSVATTTTSRPAANDNRDSRQPENKTLKVAADRLDSLIDRVGELVIAGAGNQVQAEKTGQAGMLEAAAHLLALVEDIRDMALQLRMVAIGEVFSRFPRVVRDISAELGKEIDLVVHGAEAELDKTMVEKVADPLMHLLRNAMDHGIETADERVAAGKPVRGTITLKAFHESGAIIIEVSDDGRGLNPDTILTKAIEKGIVPEGANLSRNDINQLILEPGFSTASAVTNLSGRGVGMDVVKSNLEALRGNLEIHSEPGQGTTMRLCLPLTLAIIDGFHVGVGDASFIVPLDMVVECLELPSGMNSVDVMEHQQEALPIVRLRDLFGSHGTAHARPRVVTIRFGGKCIGLVVDRIHGKCQTVIKPLGPLFQHVPCVAGSTILGDGDVALILDVVQLVRHVMTREQRRHALQEGLAA